MKYIKRYSKFNEQLYYETCCDCLYYGYSPNRFIDTISRERKSEIYKQAKEDMENL